MTESDNPALSTLRRRRGVARASITRLGTRLRELEGKIPDSSTPSIAHRMCQKLESLDSEFQTHHLSIIDALQDGDEDGLAKEQGMPDKHA